MTTNDKSFSQSLPSGPSKRAPAAKVQSCEPNNAGLIEIQIQYRALETLVLDSRNPRQHSQRQVNQIADSIQRVRFFDARGHR